MTEATVECPHCQTQNSGDAETCSSCGQPMPQAAMSGAMLEDGETVHFDSADLEDEGSQATILPDQEAAASRLGSEEVTATPPPSAVKPPSSGTLRPGQSLGGRFQIEAELGAGGMGAVYKARDLELDRTVALKVIRPHLAEDQEILQRFKHEIILSREITHRNVVRIFDLGQADDIRFISMEFVEGTDLSHILRDQGALPVGDAVDVIEQVCLALDAAHNEGVVHRDLKPQNIMIAPDGRVVVMDFGIARSIELSGMTQTGSLLGTPDYMSPEQVKGEKVDARSDLFAVGIIFYQLLTGELPYKGDTPMAAMFTRTQARAAPVRDINPDLPGFLGDVVGRCLEIQPHKRYQSARELLQDLAVWRGGSTPMTIGPTMMRSLKPTTTRARTRLRLAAIVGGAAVMIVLLAGGVMWVRSRPAGQDAGAGQAAVVPADVTSLAILPFRNVSGDAELAWLGPGLAEMLRTDVGQSASLRTVSSDRLHQILRDLRVSTDASLDESTLRRVAEFSNADTVVWGQFAKLGDQIRIDATVRDFERHVTAPVKVEVPDEQQLLRAVQELAQGVRDNLALSRQVVRELERQAFIPSAGSVVSLRHYNEGLELMRQGNNLEAVTRLETAVEGDPEFALAHSTLAQAYLQLGRGQRADDSARRAVELSDDLPDQERYLILAQSARVERDYEQGIDAYQNLLRFRPTDAELNYELGVLYEEGGSFEEALDHVRRSLEADPQNVTSQLALGRILIKSGQIQESLAPLNQALSLAIQVDNQEARANTLQAIGIAYRYLGRPEEALDNFQQSLAIKREIGDQRGVASSLSMIGQVQAGAGDLEQARTSFEQAIEISREIGDDTGVASSLMDLGEVDRMAGRYDEALTGLREALRIQMEIGAVWNQARTLNNIGVIYDDRGEYAESLIYHQRALELREQLGEPRQIADSLHNIAETYVSMARYDQAVDHYMRALETRRGAADEWGTAIESYSLGQVYGYQGRYGAAVASMEEALETLRRLGDTGRWYVEILSGYGGALTMLGRFEDADPVLEEAVASARELGDAALISAALSFQGDRRFYAGDPQAARGLYEEAETAANEAEDPYAVLAARAGLARVDLASGRTRQAMPVLEGIVREASSRGARYLETQCTVCMGSALLASGDADGAERRARKALGDAEDMGARVLLVQSHHLLAGILSGQGRAEEASRHAAKATEYLDEIRAEAGTDSLLLRSDLRPIAE